MKRSNKGNTAVIDISQALFFVQSDIHWKCDGKLCHKSLLVLLWGKFTLRGNTLNARLLLQKITIGSSSFVLVVLLFITRRGVCALISDTHMYTAGLSRPNWRVPEIITLPFCYPWEGMNRALHQETLEATSCRKLLSRLKRKQLILLAVASGSVPNLYNLLQNRLESPGRLLQVVGLVWMATRYAKPVP